MFCNQCEETARGCACTARGVCGKDPETAGLQDVLIFVCRGLASRNLAAGEKGDPDVGMFIAGALFGTLTNVDFDPDRIRRLIREAIALRDLLPPAGPDEPEASTWIPADDAVIAAKAGEIAADAAIDDDVHSLRSLLLAGLKGLAAYYYHAVSLGYTDESVTEFLQRALAAGLRELTADELVGLAVECGTVGVTALALLDRANTETFGHPQITTVRTTVGDRPGILVTGHDLADLKRAPRADTRQRSRRLHPRRDAAGPRLPGVQGLLPPRRQLRRGLVEAGRRVRALQRPGPGHDELHRAAAGVVPGPDLHHRPGRLSRRPAHRHGPRRHQGLLAPCRAGETVSAARAARGVGARADHGLRAPGGRRDRGIGGRRD